MTDAEILHNGYNKLIQNAKKKNVPTETEKKNIAGTASTASLMLMRLTDRELSIPAEEMQKYVIASKGIIAQFGAMKARNPNLIPKSLEQSVEQLIGAVCEYEAEQLALYRMQEPGGERIDLGEVFREPKTCKRLSTELALDILKEGMQEQTDLAGSDRELFISNTGKKYHLKDCPYCKGRLMRVASPKMIELQKLSPCKCVLSSKEDKESKNITVFIDESLRPAFWKEKGDTAKIGSFSYIICRGKLSSEEQITEKRILRRAVEFVDEKVHIEKITELAIGRALFILAYNLDFSGRVHIFVDNKSISKRWNSGACNAKLEALFESVDVCFIPREQNKRADKLGRERVPLDMPVEVYNDIVKMRDRVKKLEGQVKRLEREKTAMVEIPEVIVAGQVKEVLPVQARLEKGEKTSLLDKIKGCIDDWIVSRFGKKAAE